MTLPKNRTQDAVLLALSKGQMRIAVEGSTDVVELREWEGRWTMDDGAPVELDGLMTDGNTDMALFSEWYPRASAAGQSGEKAILVGAREGYGRDASAN
jgi:hypothetical protein